ncbi:hypothetical protein ACQ4PT_070135 [Festuca glaucescens]
MAAPVLAKRKRPCNPSSSSSSSSCRDPKRHRPITPAPCMLEKHDDAAEAAPSPSQSQPLLPGLPDHLAQLCLAPLPPRLLHAVCRPWRRLLYAPSFPPFLSLYALLEDAGDGHAASFAAYDPIAARWDALPAPPMPSPPPTLWHPSFLSRRLPLQCVAAAGRLVLVAGSTQSLRPALPRPLVFDPAAPRWLVGPRIPLAPRRWCAAGAARGRVFVAGGVGAGYDLAVARSGASWDPAAPSAAWEAAPPLRDGRFSRDAADAVCSGGKVCMVSLRGRGAKEGAVLDLDEGRWEDMPPGMLAGWKGPAAASPGHRRHDLSGRRGARGAERVRQGDGPVEDGRGGGASQGRLGDGGRRRQGVRRGRRRQEGGGRGRHDAQGDDDEEKFQLQVHVGAAHVGGGGAGRAADRVPARAA